MAACVFDIAQRSVTVEISTLVLAAFAGRDREATERHILDMRKKGVARPASVPSFHRVIPTLLSQADGQEVHGGDTTPEVEFVIFSHAGEHFVTVGNDQCDLAVEAAGMAGKSKNLCNKMVARSAWPLREVVDHWDRLRLQMLVNETVVVDESVSLLLPPTELLAMAKTVTGRATNDNLMVFSGTVGALKSLPATTYRVGIRLVDPHLKRSLDHLFTVTQIHED